jgi:hypothetical protein
MSKIEAVRRDTTYRPRTAPPARGHYMVRPRPAPAALSARTDLPSFARGLAVGVLWCAAHALLAVLRPDAGGAR